ncbi:MAG: hypothetical protein IJ468_12860 [Lachnospiraceae bacterium]|nr:hypothetical protein [Lachnospiraceae bacterium]
MSGRRNEADPEGFDRGGQMKPVRQGSQTELTRRNRLDRASQTEPVRQSQSDRVSQTEPVRQKQSDRTRDRL